MLRIEGSNTFNPVTDDRDSYFTGHVCREQYIAILTYYTGVGETHDICHLRMVRVICKSIGWFLLSTFLPKVSGHDLMLLAASGIR